MKIFYSLSVSLVIGLFFLFSFPAVASATTYYVDSSITDTNVGSATPDFTTYNPTTFATDTGSASVYKTIADINTFSSLQPGDQVLFRKGQTWLEQLIVPASGTDGHQITFSSYGEGVNPKLIGSDVFDVSGYTLSLGQTNTYEAVMATTPGWVWENTFPLAQKTSVATVEATAGTWWWDSVSQKLYIHSYDSSNISTNGKIYEKSGRDHNIDTNAKDYIIIDGIDCVRTGGSDLTAGGIKVTGDYTIVRNLTTEGHRRHAAGFAYGASNGLFENMTIKDSYVTAALALYDLGTTANTIRNCDTSSPTFRTTYAISVVIHGQASENIIEDNDIHDGHYLIVLYDDGTDNNIIRRNHFYGASSVGVYTLGSTDNTQIYYNLFENGSNTSGPIKVDTGAINTKIYNNTFYGGGGSVLAIYVVADGTGTKIFNNIISSNKIITVGASSISNTEIDYNIHRITGTGVLYQWNGLNYSTYSTWRTASSQDQNSFNADPLFISSSDFQLQYPLSPALNSGTNVGLTTDYLGNSLYGLPDIGAYEYQPPFTFAVHSVPTTGSLRLYSDGKYRMTTASSSDALADFTVTPTDGYLATTTQYLDLTLTTWETTGDQNKAWIATSTTGDFLTLATSTTYTLGDLLP
ncbi:MAG TPA: right-handed parallel beta-helix repeat-containing protein, partial [Candidatus Paceibacterota bacterium]|nr:right-handed parallel beta-helix repeat-containing protein [Candidatus Paceibacterota bacterium]